MTSSIRTANPPIQPGLFDQVPQRRDGPDRAKIRARLLEWLTAARSAERMPWEPQEARKYGILFPQMANWLPETERDALRREFAQHMDRLRAAE